MNKEFCIQLIRIIVSLFLFIFSFVFNFSNSIINNILLIIAYVIIGYDIVLKAVKNICRAKVFDEHFLMTIATIGAFSIGEFPEGVAVMLFYQIGEMFQDYAVDKSRKSIASLMDIRADYANVYCDNQIKKCDPNKINVGDIILVKPGEKIPLDGIVVEGESMLNVNALTGEAVPRKVRVNDEVLSGSINMDGILKINVRKKFEESTVSKILELVENSSNRKSRSENFISKFARYYTPIVVIIAFLLAIIPQFVIKDAVFSDWLYRALSFLVVSCPCALVVSIPLSFFGGIGAASKIGILIKGSNYLEALANTEIVVCDKTGTLTEGVFKVQKINGIGYTDSELLKYAAYAEFFSNHLIANSIKSEYNYEINEKLVAEVKEFAGEGVLAKVDGKIILVGNESLMNKYNISFKKCEDIGTVVYVAINNIFAGTILIADKIKKDSYNAINLLKKNNVKKVVMLTGDQNDVSKNVAKELDIDEYHAELLPQDKVLWVDKLMTEKTSNGKLLFVGDGINDAPVLALSDIGVAMGGLGSDAVIEAADIIIMTDELSKIANSIKISKKTMKIVKQNVIIAIMVKIAILVLSAFGIVGMWAAVFADVGVSILAIINALRALKLEKNVEN